MSSRVIDEAEATRFERIVWRGAAARAGAPAHTEPSSAGQRAGAGRAADDMTLLQKRLVELEAGLEGRLRDSYQAGLQHGEAAARAEADAHVRAVIERLAQTIAEIAEVRTKMFRQAEADVLKLSIEVARRVLHREITLDPAAVEGLVRVALDKLRDRDIYKVRVHPEQEALVRAALQNFANTSNIQVIADPAQSLGGAVFELDCGRLDASIEAQLKEIESGLADRFAGIA